MTLNPKQDSRNANRGTERGRSALNTSLKKLGAGRSVLLDKNGVAIAGNKTLEQAELLGIPIEIVETDGSKLVAVVRKDLDLEKDPKARELAFADNRISELDLDWDLAALQEAATDDIDLTWLWTDDELQDLLDVAGYQEPGEDSEDAVADDMDAAASGKIESRVKLGEIWALGRHRIACGDSTDESNIKKLLGERLSNVGMVWADPPYGINVVSKDGSLGGNTKGKYMSIIGDETKDVAYKSFQVVIQLTDCVSIFWGANHYASVIPDSSCWIVWDKQDGKSVTFADCELAWTNVKEPARIFTHVWDGFRRDSERGETRVHPTQKPVALCEWAFDKYGTPDDLIFDPFLGSAPSIIAAQQMEGNRTVYGFELSPEYCEVICRRYERLTGEVAELAGYL